MNISSKGKFNHIKILTILAIVVSLSLGVYVLTAKDIILSVNGVEEEMVSYADTVEEFLEDEGIVLEKGAYINIPIKSELENNIKVIIETPKSYNLSMDDKTTQARSIHTVVKDILEDLDIELGELDYTEPGLDTEVSFGDEIKFFKVKEVLEEVDKTIPHESIVNNSDKLEKGKTNLVQEGKDGLNQVHVEKIFKNRKLISKNTIGEDIVNEPVPNIVEKGTKEPTPKKVTTPKKTVKKTKTKKQVTKKPVAKKQVTKKPVAKKPAKEKPNRGGSRPKNILTMSATAYDLSFASCGKRPGDKGYGITASGVMAGPGKVAVDPNVIPLGSKLYIESLDGSPDYGHAVAADTGGAIKGNRIDLFFHSSGEVRQFGRRKVKVHIL